MYEVCHWACEQERAQSAAGVVPVAAWQPTSSIIVARPVVFSESISSTRVLFCPKVKSARPTSACSLFWSSACTPR